MPRGGSRAGTPGVQYPNRVDMRSPKLPVRAAPGQPYGEAGVQLAAQRAVPMGSPPPPPPPSGPPGQPAPSAVLPGQLPSFNRPSEQPDVHVMAGAPSGPGPGLDALGLGSGGGPSLSETLAQVATASGSPELGFLAQRARNLGQ